MKGNTVVLAMLALAVWAVPAFADDCPVPAGMENYVGIATIVFTGEMEGGNHDTQLLTGMQLNGLLEKMSWQVFWAKPWGEDALMVGGSLDYLLADNFDDYYSRSCSDMSPESLWWFGAGPTVISYRDILEDETGAAIDGDELGLNLGGGYHWDEYSLQALVHYFPDSENSMFSIGVSHAF